MSNDTVDNLLFCVFGLGENTKEKRTLNFTLITLNTITTVHDNSLKVFGSLIRLSVGLPLAGLYSPAALPCPLLVLFSPNDPNARVICLIRESEHIVRVVEISYGRVVEALEPVVHLAY